MVIGGKKKTVWFDADGPAATEEKIIASARARREHALNILVSGESSLEHWYQEHPSPNREVIDYNLADEVRWRLNLKRDEGDENQKRG
jgi:hypothetical protein